MSADVMGREHVRPKVFTSGQRAGLLIGGWLVVLVSCWWVAAALTAGAAWTFAGWQAALADGLRHPPRPWTVVVAVALLAVVVAVWVWVARRLRRRVRAYAGMADRVEVRRTAGRERAQTVARYTRERSINRGVLDVEKCDPRELAWSVGTALQEPVMIPYETQVAVIAPTGGGKTRWALRGAARTACGALIVTTTKLRDYTAIIPDREKLGRVMVWDPLQTSKYGQRMYWDPVAGSEDPSVAAARGVAFAGGMEAENGDGSGKFFADACALVMGSLLLAAAVSGGSMRDVRRWGSALVTAGPQAAKILREKLPDEPWFADELMKFVRGDDKTTANVQMTLQLKLRVLMNAVVMESLVPQAGAEAFHPDHFVRSTDTLIIVTDDNARVNVAPLATMLLNEVTDAAKVFAAELGGPLDPPMRIVGDEIANVAPIPKLPAMLSDSRGAGLQFILALQSLAAVTARWGEHPGKVLLSNITGLVVLGGLQDTEALERFESLAGRVEVKEATSTLNATGHRVTSTNFAVHERAVMRAEEIAHLPEGRAFVQIGRGRPLIVDLVADDERVPA